MIHFFLDPEDDSVKVNISVSISVCIAVVGLSSLFSDGQIFPHILQTGVSFGIQILPITRLLKSKDHVNFAMRRIKQIKQTYFI